MVCRRAANKAMRNAVRRNRPISYCRRVAYRAAIRAGK